MGSITCFSTLEWLYNNSSFLLILGAARLWGSNGFDRLALPALAWYRGLIHWLTVLSERTWSFAELKELAAESLELLKAAIYDKDYPDLFDLQLFGSLVGMFELNNMGLSIPSPLLQWLKTLDEHKNDPSSNASSSSLMTGNKMLPISLLTEMPIIEDVAALEPQMRPGDDALRQAYLETWNKLTMISDSWLLHCQMRWGKPLRRVWKKVRLVRALASMQSWAVQITAALQMPA